ncbi:cache domain-containing protein [Oceanospirillum sanctuarii]|uniref:cache domain-containing protein n=1 Tax=Oceanospirillum sanctuarii TaxID=1434821 RepID=UPI000A39D5F8|nr:cache domain-containing protein [Oceanospirillum sanctuarii]
MSLKTKILLLALVPLMLVTTSITLISAQQVKRLSETEIAIFEHNLLESKRTELQHYVSLAMSSISPILNRTDLSEEEAQEQVKAVLAAITFGSDGYFFVYDKHGVNLVHPIQPELVGLNLIDMQDAQGDFVIQRLLELSHTGGGYHHYMWNKPSNGQESEKIGYVIELPRWNWMLGTGLYIDDIAEEVAKIRHEVKLNIRNTFFTVLAITTITIGLIVVFVILFNVHEHRLADSRLKELVHKTVQFQESERRRFSRELHDGINQLLVSAKFRLELGADSVGDKNPKAQSHLAKASAVMNEAIQEIRRISHDLRPSALDDLGLIPAMTMVLDEFRLRTGMTVEQNTPPCRMRLPEEIETTLYRIVQEALTNVERHSEAKHLKVTTGWHKDTFHLTLVDDGVGFNVHDVMSGSGIGLRNMRERVEFLSGDFIIESAPRQGTLVRAQFPMHSWQPLLLQEKNMSSDDPLPDNLTGQLPG